MSIATAVASVSHAVLVMTGPGFWEGIFGTAIPFISHALPNRQLTVYAFSSFFIAGVEVAVSIIVCSMSVVIPVILRALGVGGPFM